MRYDFSVVTPHLAGRGIGEKGNQEDREGRFEILTVILRLASSPCPEGKEKEKLL